LPTSRRCRYQRWPQRTMRRVAQMKKELEADAADSKWLTEVLAR